MFKVLITDDDYEDRELLRLEIQKALKGKEPNISFSEAGSIKQANEQLRGRPFDLMTLDIQFDRLNEGIEALPGFFETYPTLNIIVISGKLNKGEVLEELFRFTKENILKGKRWARHFDILDKKDDKTEALLRAHSFVFNQKEKTGQLKELFLLAESHLDAGELEKCIGVYQKIQGLAPGEAESGENIRLFRGIGVAEQAMEYLRKGETVTASLLLGYHIETRLKAFTRRALGKSPHGLYDCLKELERAHRISPYKKSLFQEMLRLRNKTVHHPSTAAEADFETAFKNLKLLEANF